MVIKHLSESQPLCEWLASVNVRCVRRHHSHSVFINAGQLHSQTASWTTCR